MGGTIQEMELQGEEGMDGLKLRTQIADITCKHDELLGAFFQSSEGSLSNKMYKCFLCEKRMSQFRLTGPSRNAALSMCCAFLGHLTCIKKAFKVDWACEGYSQPVAQSRETRLFTKSCTAFCPNCLTTDIIKKRPAYRAQTKVIAKFKALEVNLKEFAYLRRIVCLKRQQDESYDEHEHGSFALLVFVYKMEWTI